MLCIDIIDDEIIVASEVYDHEREAFNAFYMSKLSKKSSKRSWIFCLRVTFIEKKLF
jgi:hypothetical protein